MSRLGFQLVKELLLLDDILIAQNWLNSEDLLVVLTHLLPFTGIDAQERRSQAILLQGRLFPFDLLVAFVIFGLETGVWLLLHDFVRGNRRVVEQVVIVVVCIARQVLGLILLDLNVVAAEVPQELTLDWIKDSQIDLSAGQQ